MTPEQLAADEIREHVQTLNGLLHKAAATHGLRVGLDTSLQHVFMGRPEVTVLQVKIMKDV